AGIGGADATLEQLHEIPADRLTELAKGKLGLSPSLVVGDTVVPEPILVAFQRGREAALPLIVGSNSDEASVAVAFGIDPAALVRRLGAARVAIKTLYPDQNDEGALGREVVTDLVFAAYARRIAYLHSTRAPTWRYFFSRVADNLRPQLASGVPHGGEIPAIFDLDAGCGCLGAPLTSADREASRRVADYWVAFARDGVPAAAGAPAWPRDGRQRAETMEFGADRIVARTDLHKRRLNTFIGTLNVLGFMSGR
ncbi:MAG: carboxylesterase family protein, partial [Caldimonas sp.]